MPVRAGHRAWRMIRRTGLNAMTVKQLSIYLENSPGRLLEIARVFGDAGINLKALVLGDADGFGVLRLIVSDLHKARNIAMEHRWPARVDEVLAVRIRDRPGSLAALLTPLNEKQIDVEYMYALTGFSPSHAVMFFGFKDVQEAAAVLRGCNADIIGIEELKALEEAGK